jgi:hypothetical protein
MLTDDTDTPGNRHWEIDVAYTTEHRPGRSVCQSPLLDLNYGLGSRIELNLEVPWLWDFEHNRCKNGLGDTDFAIKWLFVDGGERGLSISTYPRVSFNSCRASVQSGLVENDSAFFLPLEITKNFGPVQGNVEFGVGFHRAEGQEISFGVVLGHHFNKRFEGLIEYHSDWQLAERTQDEVINIGGRYEFAPGRSLLASVGRGLRRSPANSLSGIGYVGLEFVF